MFLVKVYNRVRVRLYHRWAQYTRKWRALPSALIIGPRRTGTTSLYQTLRRHSMVFGAGRKEIKYFDCNYQRGLDYYQSFFPYQWKLNRKNGLAIEASPYYIYHPLAAERIANDFPDMKMIALLRNPIDRAYSNYHMNCDLEVESLPTFEQAIEAEAERLEGEVEKIKASDSYPLFTHMHLSYLDQGIYADQLKRWFTFFPRKQILVLQSERFYRDMAQVYGEILDFLSLPRQSLKNKKNVNPGEYQPMQANTRQKLVDFFSPHNQRLYQLLGEEYDWDQ
jgi:hypothetical protein